MEKKYKTNIVLEALIGILEAKKILKENEVFNLIDKVGNHNQAGHIREG